MSSTHECRIGSVDLTRNVMAIFSRRTLQRLINENASFLTKKQIKKHVDALNKADEQSLGFEWEVVLLNVFNKKGIVNHEPPMGRTPDIHFISEADRSQEFIADIATVSDRGVDEPVPIQALYVKFSDTIYRKGLNNDRFNLLVGYEEDRNAWPRENPRLKIPHRSQLDTVVFNKSFYDFLDAVSQAPEQEHQHVIASTTPSIDIRITYDPAQKRSSNSWPAYKELKSLTRNTVYSALERKYDQLANANYSGHRAIIVCDGGCSHLSMTRYFYEDHIDDVFRYFLREHPEISFILTIAVQETFGHGAQRKIIVRQYQGRTFADVGPEIRAALDNMDKLFPEAERSALNAGHLLDSRNRNQGVSFIGGWRMSGGEMRISARGVLELLSGRITPERFLELHGWSPSANPFGSQLDAGRLIASIGIETGEAEHDDDWLTIEFGQPDPAVSPFKTPE